MRAMSVPSPSGYREKMSRLARSYCWPRPVLTPPGLAISDMRFHSCAFLSLDELKDERRQDQLHREVQLGPVDDDRVGARHKAARNHRQQIWKIDPARILEADDDHRLVGRRYPPGDERVRSIHRRHALEIDVRLSELRTDIIDVIRHTPEDGVGDRLGGIAARISVAVQLLDPFEIDDGNDTDLEIRVLSDIHLV